MKELYIGIGVVVITLVVLFLSQTALFKKMPYKYRHILTKNEYGFWRVLQSKAAKNDLLICPKVRMEDFISVTSKSDRQRQVWRGKIKSRHIDFVLCDKDMKMLAGLELDDNSHKYNKATIESDKFKNKVFTTIGLPLYRVEVGKDYARQIDEIMFSIKNSQEEQ